jgi:S-adenosylmethionine-dependent methyltransferase
VSGYTISFLDHCHGQSTAPEIALISLRIVIDKAAGDVGYREARGARRGRKRPGHAQTWGATELSRLFNVRSFDVILCHNLLEYVEDPGAVLHGAVRLMRLPAAILSILVRNQAGEVLKAAIQTGDLAGAESVLTADWGEELPRTAAYFTDWQNGTTK